jgi:hypothetical protein
MYIAADGQLLQSSMVKEGSPSKRQLTGSASQVRFDLPETSSEKEYSGNEVDSFLSEDWEDMDEDNNDSFDHKYVFNSESHEVMRGRSLNRDDRCEVSQCMRDLVSTSPQRNKLFIRPNSKLNSQLIPIPVEARLPPVLSLEGKRTNRPTSLVFNGVDYEPLELNFVNSRYLQKKVKDLRPQIIEPAKSQSEITIPDLDAPIRSHNQPQSFSFDNEKEIANPSPTAKRLNNELNRTFSFPPRSHTTEVVQKLSANEDARLKDLPPLPSKKPWLPIIENPNPTTTGLQIFHDGEILEQERLQNALGRFATHSPQLASPTRRGAVYTHRHRRSKSIIEPLDESLSVEDSIVNKPSKTPPPPLMRNLLNTPAARDLSPPSQNPQVYGLWKPVLNTREESPASSQYSLPNSIQESAQSLQRSESSVYSVCTPVESTDDQRSVQGSIQSSQASTGETISSSESTQLFDLRDLIISAGGDLTLTGKQIEEMDRAIASQSHIYDEPAPQIIADKATSKIYPVGRSSFKESDGQPLNSFMQPHQIYAKDTVESDTIRSISQSKNFRLRKSPLLSQSSYESEISEPFSYASTANTADTMFSSHVQASPLAHLNIISKDKASVTGYGRQRSYRSIMKEMDNGEFQETIVLDSDDERDSDDLIITKIKKIGNPSPAISRFSFETIASEAQTDQYHLSGERQLRRYTSKRKSVMELCDDAMNNTKEVMNNLKRQRTILIQRRNELMKQQEKDIDKLKAIKDLQDKVKRVHDREQSLQRELTEKRNMDHYFDYANSESYDFETFMRSKSKPNVSLVSSELSHV